MKTKTLTLRQIRRERKAYAASIEAMRERDRANIAVLADRQRAARMEARA